MPKVTGIGGVFFKCEDPQKLYAWYEKYLGITRKDGYVAFQHAGEGMTTWCLFKKQSDYFGSPALPFMINYCVDDLDGMLAVFEGEGLDVGLKREDSEFGRFAWISDPEGNRIELWEPPK